MPYLRMFLDNQPIDEVFISDHLMQTVLGWNIVDEEKQKLQEKHSEIIKRTDLSLSFCVDAVASSTNFFNPLDTKVLK